MVGGAALIGYSSDQVVTGWRELWTGKNQVGVTEQVLAAAGEFDREHDLLGKAITLETTFGQFWLVPITQGVSGTLRSCSYYLVEIRYASRAAQSESYLFRGTTKGYLGSPGLQRIGITPTSTDPGVATTFATESAAFGEPIVQVMPRSNLQGVEILEGNVLKALEKEVGVSLTPAEFAQKAAIEISAEKARLILKELGVNIPRKIHGKNAISTTLEATPKLTEQQIQQFVNQVMNQ